MIFKIASYDPLKKIDFRVWVLICLIRLTAECKCGIPHRLNYISQSLQ